MTQQVPRTRTTLWATRNELTQIDETARAVGLSRNALLIRLGLLAATYPRLAKLAVAQVTRDVAEHTRLRPFDHTELAPLAAVLEGGDA